MLVVAVVGWIEVCSLTASRYPSSATNYHSDDCIDTLCHLCRHIHCFRPRRHPCRCLCCKRTRHGPPYPLRYKYSRRNQHRHQLRRLCLGCNQQHRARRRYCPYKYSCCCRDPLRLLCLVVCFEMQFDFPRHSCRCTDSPMQLSLKRKQYCPNDRRH